MKTPGSALPQRPARRQLLTVRVLIGSGVVLVAAALAVSILPASQGVLRSGMLCVALLLFAAVTLDPVAGGITGVSGYFFFHGFVVNSMGDFTGHGVADIMRFTSVIVAVGIGIVVGAKYREAIHRQGNSRRAGKS